MPLLAALPAIASIGSTVVGAIGASKAANAQKAAAQTAANTQMQMYNQTRSDLSPFLSGGGGAFSQLQALFGTGGGGGQASGLQTGAGGGGPVSQLGTAGPPIGGAAGGGGGFNPGLAASALAQTPGYQFGLDQGVQALDRSAASRGLLLSGAQLKDAQQFGTNYAMQQAWAPYISELNFMSQLGENAGAQSGTLGASAASGAAQSQLAAGQASAAGTVGVTNQITGLLANGQQNNWWGIGQQPSQPSSELNGLY